jgi:hypothetical protein
MFTDNKTQKHKITIQNVLFDFNVFIDGISRLFFALSIKSTNTYTNEKQKFSIHQ